MVSSLALTICLMQTLTLDLHSSAYKHEHHAPSSPPGPPPPGPPPHGPDSHPSGPPHHPPHGLVKVFAGTGIGSVDLLYVDAQISNRTTLISKAKASIGDVTVGVLHGFKGLLLEGARIGEVGFKNPGNTTIHVVKEVHRGPGGFIKAFIGPKPPHPPKHHHHKKPKKDKKDKKDKKEHKKHLREHHHKHADAKEEDDDEETDLFRDHPDVPDSPPPPPPPHGPEGPEHHGERFLSSNLAPASALISVSDVQVTLTDLLTLRPLLARARTDVSRRIPSFSTESLSDTCLTPLEQLPRTMALTHLQATASSPPSPRPARLKSSFTDRVCPYFLSSLTVL